MGAAPPRLLPLAPVVSAVLDSVGLAPHTRTMAGTAAVAAPSWASVPAASITDLMWLAYGSWAYNDVSQNIDATPLWIPQLSMALGMVALFLAFAEELIYVLRHRHLPAQQNPELARTE